MNVIKNLNKYKKEQKKELLQKELMRRIDLITTLGEPASKYEIIDRREMTLDLIDEFLALNPKSNSIKSVVPSSEKIRIRVGPGNYELRYRYELRNGIKGPKLLDTSRDFCVHLIDADKLYTRDEIGRMSNGFGLPVFQFTGGYYHNPDTGITTPFCRHVWTENIVIRK